MSESIKLILPGSAALPRQLRIDVDEKRVNVAVCARTGKGGVGTPLVVLQAFFNGPLGYGSQTFTLGGDKLTIGLGCIQVSPQEATLIGAHFAGHGLTIEMKAASV